ncbi:MAG TPA: response regulator [Anaerolineales bacterium]
MSQKKVLVVDDDKLICWALEKEFAGLGLSTQVVENGADALAELRRQPYDIVFLDIHLPDSNGIEILREIDKISPVAKIIVISGDASETNRQRAYNGGALQFLEKPFELSDVHAVLRSLTGQYPRNRKHPRYICRIPLRITIQELALDEARHDLHNMNAMMADVGSGGLRLRTEYPLCVGQSVRAHVAAGDDPILKLLPPQATAEVVWIAPAQDTYTAGLKFLSC